MDISEVFAANLRKARKEKGLSQEELAYDAGVNRSYLSTLESGKVDPGIRMLAKLAAVLDVEVADLLRVQKRKISKKA